MKARTKREADWQDPIVAEVRAARKALFAAQANSGHPVVTRRSRRASSRAVNTMELPHRRTKTG